MLDLNDILIYYKNGLILAIKKDDVFSMTRNEIKILVVDDDEDILQAAELFLRQHFAYVKTEKDPNNIPAYIKKEIYDVILLDMNFTRDVTSGSEGFYWMRKIHEIDQSAVIVMITAYGDTELAVRAIKEGATDFVVKPWQNEKLLATISAAADLHKSRVEINNLKNRERILSQELDKPFNEIVGSSTAIQEVYKKVKKVATTDANVLILGENGTGKELVARALHRLSGRSDKVFISVDMGAISETLFESELFGHVKGAFTDARDNRPGRFEIASGGTLFLDEIGNLPFQLQAKVLTVLENREVIRLGSNKKIPIDIRLISATNMPIYESVENREFRQDLLYRINTVEIHLPPLRERKGDIPLLADHFLEKYAKKYNKSRLSISQSAMRKLENYQWYGNVRELQNMIERIVIMSESKIIQPGDFSFNVDREETTDKLTICSFYLDDVERKVISAVIKKNEGNISKASLELGLTRAALYRRMQKYGL